MRYLILFFTLMTVSICSFGQDCNISAKANSITPNRLCSPVSVSWQVSYSGVNDGGTPVLIQFDWDDGVVETQPVIASGPGFFQTTVGHVYLSTGDKCNYRPQASLTVNGINCSSSTQEQIVTVWDNDDHNGGEMHIFPETYPVCLGNSANVRFQDLTQFNCVPPQEEDVPNLYTRWIQWIYGTDITMTGLPVTVNGASVSFPYRGPIVTLPGPVTSSGVYSDIMNVANDKLIGQHFQVTLRNWNYCNPYDDPDIPGPPADPVNGDFPPVTTTAIILIVPYPDATITPVDTLCIDHNPVTLTGHDSGGTWSGDGVSGNTFNPSAAGVGNHIIKYEISNANGCTDSDQIVITVTPAPIVNINPVNTMYFNDPPVTLTASPAGGSWSGEGVSLSMFSPLVAGLGTHLISYQSLPGKLGCSGTDTIHINVIMPQLPEAYFEPDTTGCSPLTVHFRNKSLNGESYLWDFGDKTYSFEINPSHLYFIPGDYVINLTVTNISGKSVYTGEIKVFQNPTAIFNVYPTEVINNSQVVTFYNHSLNSVSYFWNFGDGETSVLENPRHKYLEEGIFIVSLITTSTDGCTDSSIYKSPVSVEFKPGQIAFPNAFRWNKSGTNGGYWNEDQIDDFIFRPFFTNVISYYLQIFNRWGVLIYESKDLYKGWDGYYGNGHLAIQGVYVWKVTGQYADGSYFNKAGDVTFLH